MILSPKDFDNDKKFECDFCVVGSGAGGAVVAKELAEAGFSVIVVEEGLRYTPKDISREPRWIFTHLLREAGLRTTRGNVFIPTMQAKCLGGTTFINSAICYRAPDYVWKTWRERFGLEGYEKSDVEASYKKIEQTCNIAPTAFEIQGKKNLVIKRGLEALGLQSEPLPRAVKNCEGCSDCLAGCPTGAKQSMDVSYIPLAVAKGAKVITGCRAEKVLTDAKRTRAIGVECSILVNDVPKYKASISTKKAVILSAGVMATPVILLKSGLNTKNGRVGKNLKIHPGIGVVGVFEEEINPWYGAFQGWGTKELLDRGIMLETVWAPPAIISVRLPGFGKRFKQSLAKLKHISAIAITTLGKNSEGQVIPKSGFDPLIKFHMSEKDSFELQEAALLAAKIFFAAGAKEVMTGIYGMPEKFESASEAEALVEKHLAPNCFTIVANHVFGTCAFGEDKNLCVCHSTGEHWDVRDLFVCDSSLMPTPTAVNPQETIMAIADQIARALALRYA